MLLLLLYAACYQVFLFTFLGYKMKRRVGAIEEFEFQPLVGGSQLQMTLPPKQLHITIAITGWLSDTIQGQWSVGLFGSVS